MEETALEPSPVTKTLPSRALSRPVRFLGKWTGLKTNQFEEHTVLKTVALIGFAAALALPSASAFAVSGATPSYGSEDGGPTIPTQSLTTFDRAYNHANESKERARAGAEWIRQHGIFGHQQP
jgi:hypothetical protein